MKTLIAVLFVLISSNCFSQSLEHKILKISSESELRISGDTNINSFNCIFDPEELPESLNASYQKTDDKVLVFNSTSLKLNTKAFDCGSRPINRDFEALIKAEKYPFIYLNLEELKLQSQNSALISLNIEIAGIKKQYKVPVKIDNSKSNYKGIIHLNIDDFKLEPPKKIFGLIKVKEEIEIEFDLYFKE